MENIKWCRKKLKISQKELANRLGLDQSTYCYIENGKLFFNGLPDLKKNAISILMQKMENRLEQLKNEIVELEVMIEALKTNL